VGEDRPDPHGVQMIKAALKRLLERWDLRAQPAHRKTQIQERAREANRLHKALEDTAIKLDCVATESSAFPGGGCSKRSSQAQLIPRSLPTLPRVKQVPGRKTDVSDAAWLCQLAEAGLLKSSFVAPKPFRALRNLTR